MDTPNNNLYETDYYQWTRQQSELIRQRRFDELDLNNLAEEVADMGKSEPRSLTSELKTILLHLLKYDYQTRKINPGLPEPYDCRDWLDSIGRARDDARDILADNPSLKQKQDKLTVTAYKRAKTLAIKEMNRYLLPQQQLTSRSFPKVCPWSFEQIIDDDWLPS